MFRPRLKVVKYTSIQFFPPKLQFLYTLLYYTSNDCQIASALSLFLTIVNLYFSIALLYEFKDCLKCHCPKPIFENESFWVDVFRPCSLISRSPLLSLKAVGRNIRIIFHELFILLIYTVPLLFLIKRLALGLQNV